MYAKFNHNIPLSSRDRAIFTLSEFGARQSLDQKKKKKKKNVSSQSLGLDLVNINVYAKIIKIFHSVQEIEPFSLFQNFAFGILQFLGLDLFNIKLSAKFYQNIPNSLRVNFHLFFFSEFEPQQNLD